MESGSDTSYLSKVMVTDWTHSVMIDHISLFSFISWLILEKVVSYLCRDKDEY